MSDNIYLYILVMAGVTYLIRLIPLTIMRKEIKNVYIKSFLYYVPFVTLAVMTFPAVLKSTATIWSALGGFVMAIIFAYQGNSLFKVSLVACLSVFVIEFITCWIISNICCVKELNSKRNKAVSHLYHLNSEYLPSHKICGFFPVLVSPKSVRSGFKNKMTIFIRFYMDLAGI